MSQNINNEILLMIEKEKKLKLYSNDDLMEVLITVSFLLGDWHNFMLSVDPNHSKILGWKRKIKRIKNIQKKCKNELFFRLNKKGN